MVIGRNVFDKLVGQSVTRVNERIRKYPKKFSECPRNNFRRGKKKTLFLFLS